MSKPFDAGLVLGLLPEGWSFEEIPNYGTVISTYEKRGFVTVSEPFRSFEMGISIIKNRGNYYGRNWRKRLYQDAIAVLGVASSSLPKSSEQ